MKKLFSGLIIFLLILLSGCSESNDWEVNFTKPLYFSKEKAVPFEIKVTDGDKAVEGLKVSAALSMVNMDHGSFDIALAEKEDGIYAGEAELPMEGKWEIVFTMEKDGKETEKVVQYEVKGAKGVATLNGEWITNDDLEFYRFINKLHIEISREADNEKYKGKALEEAMAYWDAQEKLNEDQNQLLTQIIRLRSMALLALEKGHEAAPDEVKAEIDQVREQYQQSEAAQKLINDFGEDKFWDTERTQYELIVLSQKVQQDLIERVTKENPKASEQEIQYLAQKQYEELLVSQVNSMEIEFL
ncbi:hypothetical protein CVD25_19865 [Bacillus canaveralius]|uniref:YtkA-like domain-containing protein n=1 Tax=Bacillus canaveralius TaxID=1403243 RepID=A0A2N5GK24_9BACI|nr:FixH family protein [Bacillus canaveralius]PLR81602.1 hypothetical protein CU635_14740 [Bacillus canaveralius]PLR90857.1 hypothetical protein CVD25_19865 [Bacillus canaveralius]